MAAVRPSVQTDRRQDAKGCRRGGARTLRGLAALPRHAALIAPDGTARWVLRRQSELLLVR